MQTTRQRTEKGFFLNQTTEYRFDTQTLCLFDYVENNKRNQLSKREILATILRYLVHQIIH